MTCRILAVMISAQSLIGVTACSSGAGQLNGISLGGAGSDGHSKGDGDDDNEKKKANAPQQVAGSFLTCAYWSSAQEVARAANSGQPIELGCGLFKKSGDSASLTDVAGFSLKTSVMCNGGALQKAPAAMLKSGSPLHFETSFNEEQFGCMVELGVTGSDGARATFGKSISTITQANAQNGFDIAADMKASGVSFGADNKPVYAGAPGGGSPLFQSIMQLVDPVIANTAKKKISLAGQLSDGGEVATPLNASDSSETQIQVGLTRKSVADAKNNGDETVNDKASAAKGAAGPKDSSAATATVGRDTAGASTDNGETVGPAKTVKATAK